MLSVLECDLILMMSFSVILLQGLVGDYMHTLVTKPIGWIFYLMLREAIKENNKQLSVQMVWSVLIPSWIVCPFWNDMAKEQNTHNFILNVNESWSCLFRSIVITNISYKTIY